MATANCIIRMTVVLRKTFSALLVLVLCIMTGWQSGSAVAGQNSGTTPTCKCCDYDPAKCVTPACCASPSDNGAPVTPAAPRSASGNEWQAIATALVILSTAPRSSVDELPLSLPSIQVGAVPIFQRDCTYLI